MPIFNLLFKSRDQQKADPAAQKLCATSIMCVCGSPPKCNGQASSRESLLLDRGVLPALTGISKMQIRSSKLCATNTRDVRMFQLSALRSAMDRPPTWRALFLIKTLCQL
ncbi:hypothetical protein CEXT_90271 [Caerostris extrusa]|uniref:Uncharacterized protein n=1 Tax=Caerostris extrusa TaxID=172846 RepID=A0AAV4RLP1_CAEEX|nr:hypothetical protein CEXT_90271 [Caerostris extrusa]